MAACIWSFHRVYIWMQSKNQREVCDPVLKVCMDGPGRRPGTYLQGWTPSMHLFCLQSPDAVHAASMHFLSIIQKTIECYQRVRHTESERDMPCLTVGMESGVLTEG